MKPNGRRLGPDIPALIVIGLLVRCVPAAVDLVSRWSVEAPVRVVLLGW
jgi:hypothetical protein